MSDPATQTEDPAPAPAAAADTGESGAAAATETDAGGETRGRGLRKTRVGIVVSDKMTQTLVVEVVRRVPHPRFKKIVKRTTKLYVHDEKEEAAVGDRVLVMETRPISRKKRWRLIEVLSH